MDFASTQEYEECREERFRIISFMENSFGVVCISDILSNLEFVSFLHEETFTIPMWFAELVMQKLQLK